MTEHLPPLKALRAFEAAGRLSSVRRAAEELFVTPGAVSRQIQSLETHLRVSLFRREARAITLTREGERYLGDVIAHFNGLRAATRNLTGGRQTANLKIRCGATFALRWLIPHLASFQEAHPGIDPRVTTSASPLDFDREDVDAAIQLGCGRFNGLECDRLTDNVLIAVGAPAIADEIARDGFAGLSAATLLHSFTRPDDWNTWLTSAGIRRPDPYAGPRYDGCVLVLEAAARQQGIAVTSRVLVADDLASGRLVQISPTEYDQGDHTYYLTYPADRLRNPAFRAFRNWVLGLASTDQTARASLPATGEKAATN